MSNTEDYKWIRAWGRLLGSRAYYIIDQVEQARKDHAPENAIYRKDDGTWATTDDITSEVTRYNLGL
ncbi:MAG TPA: hypothetical protein VFK94_06610 [Patescibacteria group bacterium]|nr:hypothetical protein [Patescibacteria group bacterium]